MISTSQSWTKAMWNIIVGRRSRSLVRRSGTRMRQDSAQVSDFKSSSACRVEEKMQLVRVRAYASRHAHEVRMSRSRSRTALLFERSGKTICGDPCWIAWATAWSKLCWASTAAYFGSLRNFGTESCMRCQVSDLQGRDGEMLTLDINLKTEVCASRNRPTTSCKLFRRESSSPTARVIRPARLLRKL